MSPISIPGKVRLNREHSDPSFNNVSLLLHGNGTNGSTTITDNSPSPKTVTAFGNAQISTVQSKFGGASIAFDGTGDYFSCSQPADGTADTTIEFWMYPTSSTVTYRALVDTRSTAPSDTGFGIFQYGLTIEVYGNGLKFLSGANVIAVNQWQHVAVVRSAGVCQIYVNGIASGASANYANNLTSTSLIAGSSVSLTSPYVGYIDDLRITKGVARYASNFSLFPAPFPDVGL